MCKMLSQKFFLVYKRFTRIQLPYYNLAKIFTRILQESWQDSWQECLIIMQDQGKVSARSIQDWCKIFVWIIQDFPRFMPNSWLDCVIMCNNYPRFLQELPKNLVKCCKNYPRIIQDPCKILQELSKIFARFLQELSKNYAIFMRD